MIIEVAIASLALVTIAGTWLGLRFAEHELYPDVQQDKTHQEALTILEQCVKADTTAARNRLKALLIARPEALPDAARCRAVEWLSNKDITMPPLKAKPQ